MVVDKVRDAASLPPNPSRGGRPIGWIKPGGLPGRVIAFLHDNPEQQLTSAQISALVDDGHVKPVKVAARLRPAIAAGYIERVMTPRGVLVFRKPRVDSPCRPV